MTLGNEEDRLRELYWGNLPGMQQSRMLMGRYGLKVLFKPHEEEPGLPSMVGVLILSADLATTWGD